jgi:hypothetical protein
LNKLAARISRFDRFHPDDALGQVGSNANNRAIARFTNGIGSCNLVNGSPLSSTSDS